MYRYLGFDGMQCWHMEDLWNKHKIYKVITEEYGTDEASETKNKYHTFI